MERFVLGIFCIVLATVLVAVWRRMRIAMRAEYIRSFDFPPGLFAKLREKRPQLSRKDCQLVAHGLRQFFLAYHRSGYRFVSMPSQVADDLSHEFILYTRNYKEFSDKAFGRFLHHLPAAALGEKQRDNEGLRRTWYFACREENINPRKPSRLPLLFALDTKLKIEDGFHYAADCEALQKGGDGTLYCGSHFFDAAHGGCGGGMVSSYSDGSSDGFGCGGGGDSGGSGCGGGGCGGGGD